MKSKATGKSAGKHSDMSRINLSALSRASSSLGEEGRERLDRFVFGMRIGWVMGKPPPGYFCIAVTKSGEVVFGYAGKEYIGVDGIRREAGFRTLEGVVIPDIEMYSALKEYWPTLDA